MRHVLILALLLVLGCDATIDPGVTEDGVLEGVAAKGTEHTTYSMMWPGFGEVYVGCLEETVEVLGYAEMVGFNQATPSGNYIDYIRFDVRTDDPFYMEFDDGTVWPLARGEDNSLYLGRQRGKKMGLLTVQANLTFVSPDGKSRTRYRAHYLAEGLDWDTGEMLGVRKLDDSWTCHLGG